MSAFVHFLCIDLTIVDAAPGVEDVGDDKRNQDRNVSHGFQRKLAGTTVGKGERALYIRVRRIISCIVISGSKQQCQDGEYRTNALYRMSSSTLFCQCQTAPAQPLQGI